MAIRFSSDTRSFFLHTGAATYAMMIDENDHLLNMHWGAPIADCDLSALLTSYVDGASFDPRQGSLPYETPTRMGCYYGTPAVGIQQAAGDTVVELKYESHQIIPGKPALNGLPATYVDDAADAETLVITLRDPLTGLRVEEMYTVFAKTARSPAASASSTMARRPWPSPMRPAAPPSSGAAILT